MLNYDEALAATKGNEAAALFLMDYVTYCHLIDDCVDDSGSINSERLVRESLNLLRHFCVPGWTQDNALRLFPLMVTGANAWIDSNTMAKSSNDKAQIASDVLKGNYHEMLYYIAYLCGGYDHMRIISGKREYDYETKG